MDNIYTCGISAEAQPGSHIDDCLLEALTLSISKHEVVHLKHNDRFYVVDWRKMLAALQNQQSK